MAKVVVSTRLDPELLKQLDRYAEQRGVSRQALVDTALLNLLEDAKGGVPVIREVQSYARVRDGVGECPGREDGKGHVWSGDDDENSCSFCGASGRQHLQEASAERSRMFSTLNPPKGTMTYGTGKAPGGGS